MPCQMKFISTAPSTALDPSSAWQSIPTVMVPHRFPTSPPTAPKPSHHPHPEVPQQNPPTSPQSTRCKRLSYSCPSKTQSSVGYIPYPVLCCCSIYFQCFTRYPNSASGFSKKEEGSISTPLSKHIPTQRTEYDSMFLSEKHRAVALIFSRKLAFSFCEIFCQFEIESSSVFAVTIFLAVNSLHAAIYFYIFIMGSPPPICDREFTSRAWSNPRCVTLASFFHW